MATKRMNLRIPRHIAESLESIAKAAGYASSCQLVRCVLVQFVGNRAEVARRICENADWMDEMIPESRDHLDPTQRKKINERL